jgi:hypothetical protein
VLKGEEMIMNLHAPAMWAFLVSVVLAVLAVLSELIHIQFVSDYPVWVAILAYIVLAVGNLVKT